MADWKDLDDDLAVMSEDELHRFCQAATQVAMMSNRVFRERFPERWTRFTTDVRARTGGGMGVQ